jgi:hypothetical protein
MAIDLSALFGQQPDYSAFISPAEQQRLQSNAGQQALLNAAIAALGMTGQTRQPISTGQVLAGALGAGMEGYNQSFDRTLKQMVTGMQLAEYKKKQDAQKRYQELVKGATTQIPQPIPMATGEGSQLEMLSRPEFGGGMADVETVGALRANLPTKEGIDLNKLQPAVMQYLAETDPVKFAELTAKSEKAPSSVQEYEYAVKNGFKGSFTDYMAKKTPGTNVTVKTGEGIVAQVGPMLKDAQIQAQGANIQIDAADRVIGAVDTGKIIAGPLATPQLKLAQIGQVLGVTGKDTAEVIANTRQAIRGFAELTLQGRKSMRGEGAITESEGKLAERAFSGDIDSLTAQEIKQIANASKRVAEYSISEYNRKLDIVGKNPEMKDIVDLYRVTPISPMKQGNVKKFNPATGKVE